MEIITNYDSFGIHNHRPVLNSFMFLFDLLSLSWCLKFGVLVTGICYNVLLFIACGHCFGDKVGWA